MLTSLIGKPNTGKSTFFNAATMLNVPMANYPFTTVQPNCGVAYIRKSCICKSLNVIDNPVNSLCIKGERFIPVKLLDIAGLVQGASTGRGLGNKFLDELRQSDALIQVVDCSGATDEEGRPCKEGSHDPLIDVEFVEREFDLWVKQILLKDWGIISRSAESGGKLVPMIAERLSGLSIRGSDIQKAILDLRLSVERPTLWNDTQIEELCGLIRKLSKPGLIVANKCDLPNTDMNIEKLKSSGRLVVPCASEAELLLRRAAKKKLIDYIPGDKNFKILEPGKLSQEQIKALKMVDEKVISRWGSTGVQDAINKIYLDILENIVVYPVEDESKLSDKKGNILPDAKIVPKNTTARGLAYRMHTDLGETFLYAVDAKTGMRLGSEQVLKDQDIIKIVAVGKRG